MVWYRLQQHRTRIAALVALLIAGAGLYFSGVLDRLAPNQPVHNASRDSATPTFALANARSAASTAVRVAPRVNHPTSAPVRSPALTGLPDTASATPVANSNRDYQADTRPTADAAHPALVFSGTEYPEIRQLVVSLYSCALERPVTLDPALSLAAAAVGTSGGVSGVPAGALEVSTYGLNQDLPTATCTAGGVDLRTAELPTGLTQIGVAVALVPESREARVVVVGR